MELSTLIMVRGYMTAFRVYGLGWREEGVMNFDFAFAMGMGGYRQM